jgi:hypothetical protein
MWPRRHRTPAGTPGVQLSPGDSFDVRVTVTADGTMTFKLV